MLEQFKSLDVSVQNTLIIAIYACITIVSCTYFLSKNTDFFDKNDPF